MEVYKDPNYPPKPPINCPGPSIPREEPYINPINGEQVRRGEEYITGPLRLIFVYKTETNTRWGFYYQSLFDRQYLHAEEEEEKEADDDHRLIKTHASMVSEEEVLAQFMTRKKPIWVDKEYDRWTSLSHAARDAVREKLFIKSVIGPAVIYAPYVSTIASPSKRAMDAFGSNKVSNSMKDLLL